MDDMIAKYKESRSAIHLEVVFGEIRNHKMQLNLNKCTFEVGSGKFFGYLVVNLASVLNLCQIINCMFVSTWVTPISTKQYYRTKDVKLGDFSLEFSFGYRNKID